jgi:hypothetical protein
MKVYFRGHLLVEMSKARYERERMCPGLKAGWYLQGNRETWYDVRPCGKRGGFFRWLFLDSICRRCSDAAYRRGFRTNYDPAP